MMVTDVADEAQGVFHIWGNTPEGASVLVRVHDFQPYFYIAGPLQAVSSSSTVFLVTAWVVTIAVCKRYHSDQCHAQHQ